MGIPNAKRILIDRDADLAFYWAHVSLLEKTEHLSFRRTIYNLEILEKDESRLVSETFTENFASDQRPKQHFFALSASISERFQAARPRLDEAWARA